MHADLHVAQLAMPLRGCTTAAGRAGTAGTLELAQLVQVLAGPSRTSYRRTGTSVLPAQRSVYVFTMIVRVVQDDSDQQKPRTIAS